MKTTLTATFIALAAAFSVPAIAVDAHDHGAMNMAATAPAPAPQSQMVDGTVKKVDKTAGKVTLAHGPLTNLGMNMGMTMAFRVKDAVWLDHMKEGDKIRFLADNPNGVYTVVKYEPIK